MTYNEIIAEVASNTGLSQTFVNRVYRAYWKAIRDHVTALPLKEDLTDEQFLELRPNINIPSLGKFNVTLDRYHRLKKQGEIIKSKSKRHVEDQSN